MFHFLLFLTFFMIIGCDYVFSAPQLCKTYDNLCGDGLRFAYPFWARNGSTEPNCGYEDMLLACLHRKTIINLSEDSTPDGRGAGYSFFVANMSIQNRTIDLVNFTVGTSTCPRPSNYSELHFVRFSSFGPRSLYEHPVTIVNIFYNCSRYPSDLVHINCLEDKINHKRSYAFQGSYYYGNIVDGTPPHFDWRKNCEEYVQHFPGMPIGGKVGRIFDTESFKSTLQLGVRFIWTRPEFCAGCEARHGRCFVYQINKLSELCIGSSLKSKIMGSSLKSKIIMAVSAGILVVLLVVLLVYRKRIISFCKKTHYFKSMMKNPTNVDLFLESYGGLSLQRYTYSDVKKMTRSFGDTLGQGGYGTVFKGKLLDGSLVAVKVLKESKGNGEEFINEVATIGRTNHINVVRLLGFCSDGSKRALVYEFLTNGSLERFIHNEDKSSTQSLSLGWDKLFQIAVGIAKGLDYLHTGCNTRILHFDIKPHNILLDDDFCPKIADFGLAKICATRDSVVSMLGGRGTAGYVAPEVSNRHFGEVSYKSDVYSYGMMTLEMIGGRKNIDVNVGHTSEIYFPHWIYNHIQKDTVLQAPEETFKDEKARKMILVSLWCIQIHPKSRPSMSKVIEMLEGDVEDLELPPNPFADSPSSSTTMMQ